MTRDEVKVLISSISVCYQKNLMPELSTEMIDVWYNLLKDLEYNEAMSATVAAIAQSPDYPPTIGKIRGLLAEAKTMRLPAADAWQLIREAVRKFGYYRKDEAEKWLGPEVWKVVCRNGWDHFCTMDRSNATTCYAQFRSAYEAEAQYNLSRSQIPEGVKRTLEALEPKVEAPWYIEQNNERYKTIAEGHWIGGLEE